VFGSRESTSSTTAGLLGKGADGKNVPGVLTCIDLSATPFYLGNSGHPEGSPFPWLVSDFGLVDAIECGITKIPRLPVRDDEGHKDDAGRPDPKYFRLWKNIRESAKPTEKIKNSITPLAVFTYAEDALKTLASQWLQRYNEIVANDAQAVPPVMIIVCDTTETSQIFFERISGQREVDGNRPCDQEAGETDALWAESLASGVRQHGNGTVHDSNRLGETQPTRSRGR